MMVLVVSTCVATGAQTLSDFRLTNVMNNEEITLESYPSCQGLVLIFTSNDCPYDPTIENYYDEWLCNGTLLLIYM